MSGGDLWLQNEAGVILHLHANRKGPMLSLVRQARPRVECPVCHRHIRKQTVANPEEFRAPKAYESLGGTNPRWAGLSLWGFGILADAGRGAMIAAAYMPTCFVSGLVRGVPVVRAAMIADSERCGVADEIGHDIG